VLPGWQRGRDRNAAQQRGRQRQNGVVRFDLALAALILDRHPNGRAALRHGDNFSAKADPAAESCGDCVGQRIVAAVDAVHRARSDRLVGAELIDQREQRQVFGIRKEKPA